MNEMSKLQSFAEFKNLGLDAKKMKNVYGGRVPRAGETAAGTTCVSPSISSSGCISYSYDQTTSNGTNYCEIKDINTPC